MLTNVGNQMLGNTGTTISLIVAVTVLLALIGTTLACLNTGVRVTYSMAKDKEMPSILGLLHGDFATPHGGIWILTGISALIGIYAVDPYTVHPITQVTLASNTGTFLVYGATCMIAVIAFSHRHDKHIFKHYVVPVIGALMNVAMLLRGGLSRGQSRRRERLRRVQGDRRRGSVDRGGRRSGSSSVRARAARRCSTRMLPSGEVIATSN